MKNSNKLSDDQKRQMLALYEEGKMDSEIAAELGNITRSAVYYWRKKLGLKSKFTYDKISKIDTKKCKELFEQGYSDYKIADILGMSPDGVYSHRKRFGLIRNKSLAENKNVSLTQIQKEILIGTLMGDASLTIGKYCKNPRFSCAHCTAQKEYVEYKTDVFQSLGSHCDYHKRTVPDKRNGLLYEDYTVVMPANPAFMPFYNAFYKDKKKHIPFELLDMFTERSLAFWFMDDGSRVREIGYALSTNCFERAELVEMQKFLKKRFGLDTKLWKANIIYIPKSSYKQFNYIILPYMCDCMLYKLIL